MVDLTFILCGLNSKKLSHPGTFPLKLLDNELQWKLSLDYDVQQDVFMLFINDRAFLEMPFQAEVSPTGPQNIEKGVIRLNNELVSSGFTQYTS